MDPEPEAGTSSSFLPPTKDSKFLRFFQKTAEELCGRENGPRTRSRNVFQLSASDQRLQVPQILPEDG
ncbi:hypothetical protein MHYP_G00265720 [Metynnis hypsauchen]